MRRRAKPAPAAAMAPLLAPVLPLLLCLLALPGTLTGAKAADTLTLGIFSYRPKATTRARWQPLANHLERALPGYKLEMQVLTLSEIEEGVRRNRLDFVFTNPVHYVRLRHENSLSGAIATLVQATPAGPVSALGGVIVRRADGPLIQDLAGLRAQRVAISGRRFLGAYYAPLRELEAAGLEVPEDLRLVDVGEPQDEVVRAVIAGGAEFGFVRTGVLEGMAREGLLNPADVAVVNPQQLPGFPYQVSTHLYPEWPFVALAQVPPELARRVAAALLAIRPDDPVARATGIDGFTVPADYTPVLDLARALRLPPFEAAPEFGVRDVWDRYRLAISAFLALGLLVAALAVGLVLTNRRLRYSHAVSERRALALTQSEQRLQASEARFRTMLDWTFDWEYWVDPTGHFFYSTPSSERIAGFSSDELLADPSLLDAMVDPADRERWHSHVQCHLPEGRSESVAEIELRIRRKDGELRWIRHHCRPVYDPRGAYLGRRVSVHDVTERKAAEEQIHSLAYFDPLTGLANRRLLLDRLGKALRESRENDETGALLMLDLDHFKTLNDSAGHDVGDRLLILVAGRLRALAGSADTVARLGGDEFVVLLSRLGREHEQATEAAQLVADKIAYALRRPYELSADIPDTPVTTSIGIALFPGDGVSLETLIKRADLALYRAKDGGRDAARFFDPSMQQDIETRATLEAALRGALDRGELSLAYQPQVDSEGRPIGAECLLRWHPAGGEPVPPPAFIPLAEETRLILPIGDWVLTQACARLADWSADPALADLTLSVNVSPRQFKQPEFVLRLQEIIANSGADPHRLTLEITEGMVMDEGPESLAKLAALGRLGVSFSMDDFGTGYSSLGYLKRLPLDEIKIDRSFVERLVTDPNDLAIVRAIVGIARSLGLTVIAEGVETQAQHDSLLALGCARFQGYLIARPMDLAQLHEWLGARDHRGGRGLTDTATLGPAARVQRNGTR